MAVPDWRITKCIDFIQRAKEQPTAWRSTTVGKAAGADVKVLQIDGSVYGDACHDFDEALLILDGQMNLDIGGKIIPLRAGEVFLVPAGLSHGVAAGSHGALVIIGG